VQKKVAGDRTFVVLTELQGPERESELSDMLGSLGRAVAVRGAGVAATGAHVERIRRLSRVAGLLIPRESFIT
jgi:hypothetical protein